MKITKDTVVTLSYTVTKTDGQVVGRTEEPLAVLIGHRFLVPGLEKAILEHHKGDEIAVTLEPKDTYGEYDERLVMTVPKDMFGDYEIAVGNIFEADSPNGPMAVVVKEIKETEVVVDGNHPLAGNVLNFIIVIDDVREATEEELKHGHAHADGHCPSEGHGHGHCCCHHHDDEEDHDHHHCCHDHDDEDDDHHCCCHDHDDEDEAEEEHHCCCHDHDDEDEAEEEHHCCCHHHHHE